MMDIGVSSSGPVACSYRAVSEEQKDRDEEKDQLRVKRKTLQDVLERCQRALELLGKEDEGAEANEEETEPEEEEEQQQRRDSFSLASPGDREVDELCDLLKSRVECPDFLKKLDCTQVSISQNISDDFSSWHLVSSNDLWEAEAADSNSEDYVLVRQEDIVDDIACFMAAYLLSLKQTKDLNPIQLQEALSKTFSVKKRRGKLRKVWDGSKVIYNVASWGATAIGIYQNPLLVKAASEVFWTSCHLVSKLL